MTDAQDTQWLSKMREELLKALGVESDEQYIDNKAKFILEDILPIFLAHETKAVAAAKPNLNPGRMVDGQGNIYMSLGESNQVKNGFIVKKLQHEQEGK